MKSDYENRLEAKIGRELQGLPELAAPASLIPRVMRSIEQPEALSWYRQPWHKWPLGWRTASLAVLVALFGGLCIAGWLISRSSGFALFLHGFAGWWTDFSVAWDTLRVLIESGVLVVRKLGTGFIIACLVLAGCSYFACVGLGTAFYRYAFARN